MILFQFYAQWFVDERSQPLVIKAPLNWATSYIKPDEFGELFGGGVIWRAPKDPSPEMTDRTIGVWGNRNVSRFRRILRERIAEFSVKEMEGPVQALEAQW
ncbi:MAG: hypothetical protein AAF564_09655 [Bacteroidota bacterium]